MLTAGGWGRSRQGPLKFALQCAPGMAAVAAAAFVAHESGWLLPVAVSLYLLAVVLTALLWGLRQAVIVSLSAVLIHSYLTIGQFAARPAAIAASVAMLLIFVLTALGVSRFTARVTGHAREAASWSAQMRDLYEFTRRTLKMDLHVEPGLQLAELIHDIFALEAVAVFDADLHEVYQAGYWSVDPQELARNAYYFETSSDDRKSGLGRRVVRLGTVPVGSLVVRGETSPLTNSAIAALVAMTFDRYRAFANESRIETERRTEQLRATVLDSLAHAYKTPLTAIRAASTGLTEMGRLTAGQAELVALIDEQAGVLNDLTTRLLTTARLDGEEIAIDATPVAVAPMIEEVLASLKDRLASMKVEVDVEDENMMLCCDRELMIMLLSQYIDNACKYSIYGTTVTIRAGLAKREAIFSVHSFGPEIPMADRERIFDRYYRSSTSSSGASGTGIGLAVAKRVATIHGGYVWVTSDEQAGTTFFAAIPATTIEEGGSR
jgi:two-component system, OmpR family, sensor histidine kinase KdpD